MKLLVRSVVTFAFIAAIGPHAALSQKAGSQEAGSQQAGSQKAGLRYTIAVQSFTNESGWEGQENLGQQLGTVMTSLLHESDRFIVVAEEEVRSQALEEQDLTASGRGTSGGQAPATGHLVGAQLILRGAITHVQDDTGGQAGGASYGQVSAGIGRSKTEIHVTFYLVDSTTGGVVASKNVIAEAKKHRLRLKFQHEHGSSEVGTEKSSNLMTVLQTATEEAIAWIAEELEEIPWEGSVVRADNGKVFINRGSREGVRTGQKFYIGKTDSLRDPATGELLGATFEEVAQVEVETTHPKFSICRLSKGEPARVRRGLNVRLAP